MEKKENQRVALTKRLLREAFIEMFKTTPIDKIHVRTLCEKAGVNRSTFYKYYDSPYDFLEEMENHMLLLVEQELQKCHSLSGSLVTICVYLENNIETARMIINNNASGDFHKRLFNLPALNSLIEARLEGCTEAEKSYITSFITTGYYQMFKEWINKDNREPINDMVKLVMTLNTVMFPATNIQ